MSRCVPPYSPDDRDVAAPVPGPPEGNTGPVPATVTQPTEGDR